MNYLLGSILYAKKVLKNLSDLGRVDVAVHNQIMEKLVELEEIIRGVAK